MQRATEDAYSCVHGALPDTSAEIGTPIRSAETHALPYGGSLPLYAVDVLERQPDEAGTAKLTRRNRSDAAALADDFEAIAGADLLTVAGGLLATVPEGQSDTRVQGSIETLLDAAGLLAASQTTTLEYALAVNQDLGAHVQFQARETRRFSVRAARGPAQVYRKNRSVPGLARHPASNGRFRVREPRSRLEKRPDEARSGSD